MKGPAVVSAMARAMLFGHILGDSQKEPGVTIIDVQPKLGDAKKFGIAGQVRVLDRQCIEFNRGGKYDVITLPEHVAASLGKPPDRPPERRPRK